MRIGRVWKVGPYDGRATFQAPVAVTASAVYPKSSKDISDRCKLSPGWKSGPQLVGVTEGENVLFLFEKYNHEISSADPVFGV